MSDEFRRLIDDRAGTPLSGVLEAGLRDHPSKRGLARAARVLGLGAGLGAAESAAAAGTARALHASLWSGFAKWGTAGLLLGSVALSPLVLNAPKPHEIQIVQLSAPRAPVKATTTTTTTTTTTSSSVAPSPAPPVPAASAPPVVPSSSVALPVLTLSSPPPLATLPSSRSFEPLTTPPPMPLDAARAGNLDSEVALLDSARTALKDDGPSAALALLDRYAKLNAPSLGAEATLLRVQALLAAGRVPEAQQVARRAIASTSAAAYAQRLEKLVGLPRD